MRVLHLLKTAVGATWALRQMRELVELGVEVHVALPEGPLLDKYQEYGIHTHVMQPGLDIRRPWRNIEKFKAIRALVDQVQPDIIHSHFVATTIAMRLALGKSHPIKRIFHVPGPLHLEHPVFKRLELACAGDSDFWLGSCEWTVNAYQGAGIDQSRLGLVYYGVDYDKDYDVDACSEAQLRQQLHLDDDVEIVGNVAYFYAPKTYLGQTRGLKGHEDLIDALDIVAITHPKVVGVFVGGPWDGADSYMRKVMDYANQKQFGRFYFLGYRTDVLDLYRDFTMAVHPSHSENVGGAGESLLCQVPTIATNVGGFPDLVKDGETGYLVPAKDPTALAAKIIEALEDPQQRRSRAQKGQALAQQLFCMRSNAESLHQYYQALLTQGKWEHKDA